MGESYARFGFAIVRDHGLDAVVIGRNEGERLLALVRSLPAERRERLNERFAAAGGGSDDQPGPPPAADARRPPGPGTLPGRDAGRPEHHAQPPVTRDTHGDGIYLGMFHTGTTPVKLVGIALEANSSTPSTPITMLVDFNGWDGRAHVMRKRRDTGIWEIFIPGAHEGQCYKYELLDAAGKLLPLKSDPFGFSAEMRPKTASKVARTDNFQWEDQAYLAKRKMIDQRRAPMSIYEVHLGSWRRGDGNRWLSYDELADALVPYAQDMGFTHLELLPISEHPFDGSWGYQPIGLYAPTARFGPPEGFGRLTWSITKYKKRTRQCLLAGHYPTDRRTAACVSLLQITMSKT